MSIKEEKRVLDWAVNMIREILLESFGTTQRREMEGYDEVDVV